MKPLLDLVREAHRRSLWQVMGIFLAASWGVLQVVEVLTETAGLPTWTPTMALVALLVGLPVVLATAFVQEGMPGGRRAAEDPASPSDDPEVAGHSAAAGEEGAKAESAVANLAAGTGSLDRPSTRPSAPRRLLTWRNAIFGGLGAFTLLGLSIFGYFVMWSSGIGPVGNLVAQGVLEESDEILLADFESRTGDASLGQVVTEALSVDLGESGIVRLASQDLVQRGLRMMGRDLDAPLTGPIAREVAVRQGIKAVIEGELSTVGTQYLLTARITQPESGNAIASFRENAADDADLLPAIDRLSTKLREKMGESLRSIRAGAPLEQVTTGSLDALLKYTQAEELESRGDYDAARRLLNEAVQLDTAFAMAYRKLSVLAFNQGFTEESEAASLAAMRHRDRLTDVEGYLAEANYHNNITLDRDAVLAAYDAALLINPDESAALNNSGNILMRRGFYEEAQERYERAMSGPGASSVAAWNLAWIRFRLGDLAGGREALAEYEAQYPGHIYGPSARLALAVAERDIEGIHEWAAVIGDDDRTPFIGVRHGAIAASADVYRGRIREALGHHAETPPEWSFYQRALREPTLASGSSLGAAGLHLWILDDRANAPARVDALLEQIGFEGPEPPDRAWDVPILGLAHAGYATEARAWYDRWIAEVPDDETEPGQRATVLAGVLAVEGDLNGALESLNRGREQSGCPSCGGWIAGPLHEARGEFDEAIRSWEGLGERARYHMAILFPRTVANKRLGPLYELAGDDAKAIEAYRALVEQWADGDALIQPQVERARARIAALGG